MRAGWNDDERNAPTLAKMVQDAGAVGDRRPRAHRGAELQRLRRLGSRRAHCRRSVDSRVRQRRLRRAGADRRSRAHRREGRSGRPRRAAQSVDSGAGRRPGRRPRAAAGDARGSRQRSSSSTSICCSHERIDEARALHEPRSLGRSTSCARSARGTRRVSTTDRTCGPPSTPPIRSRVCARRSFRSSRSAPTFRRTAPARQWYAAVRASNSGAASLRGHSAADSARRSLFLRNRSTRGQALPCRPAATPARASLDSLRRPAQPARLGRGSSGESHSRPPENHFSTTLGFFRLELVERRQQIRCVARAKCSRSVVDQERPVGKARWHGSQITACDTSPGVCASGTGAHGTLGTPGSAQRQASQQLRPFSTTGTVLALGLGTRAFCAAVLERERTHAHHRRRRCFQHHLRGVRCARSNGFVTSDDQDDGLGRGRFTQRHEGRRNHAAAEAAARGRLVRRRLRPALDVCEPGYSAGLRRLLDDHGDSARRCGAESADAGHGRQPRALHRPESRDDGGPGLSSRETLAQSSPPRRDRD